MLQIKNTQVYDLRESIISCRNSMRTDIPDYNDNEEFQKALDRACKLSVLGNGHNNFLCGIRVAYDIVYPQYISPELQRYHFNDIVSSSSKMHRLAKIVEEDCFNEWVDDARRLLTITDAEIYNNNPSYDNFMRLVSNCPLGLELFMRCTTNYLQLRNIYTQRRHHKLFDDWGAYCDWIESLPYAEELIISKK